MRQKIKKVLFAVLIALLAALIVAVVVLRICGFDFRAVLTGSMEPELPVGSMLFVRETPLENIKVGDDITFVRDKSLRVVTHRVVAIDRQTELITTQGIANNTTDAPTHYDNVLGVVKFCIPYLGYIFIFLSTTRNKIIAVTVVIAVVLIWVIMGLIFGKKKETDNPSDDSSEIRSNEKKSKDSLSSKIPDLGSWLDEADSSDALL